MKGLVKNKYIYFNMQETSFFFRLPRKLLFNLIKNKATCQMKFYLLRYFMIMIQYKSFYDKFVLSIHKFMH